MRVVENEKGLWLTWRENENKGDKQLPEKPSRLDKYKNKIGRNTTLKTG